jgi:hypothetical protein
MSYIPYLERHHQDPNLFIYYGKEYNEMPIIWQRGPYIYNYLQRIDKTIQAALNEHNTIMAVRVELSLPTQFDWMSQLRRPIFSRFSASLKAKIKARKDRTERSGSRFHATNVHYVWVREFGEKGKPHYHCVLFLNKQTFRGLGEYNPKSNSLYSMIDNAWHSALGLEQGLGDGLVTIPGREDSSRPIYWVRRGEDYSELFYRVSYFAKLPTKRFGLNSHNFGTSRAPGH